MNGVDRPYIDTRTITYVLIDYRSDLHETERITDKLVIIKSEIFSEKIVK